MSNDEQTTTSEQRPAVATRLDRGVMELVACPFCGGPPVPIATRGLHPYGAFPDGELQAPEGLYVRAVVFCHECGSEGPDETSWCHERDDVDALLRACCERWNQRDGRHADLYAASAQDGLNLWPRHN